MARSISGSDLLILQSVDIYDGSARPAWPSLLYALFATIAVAALLVFVQWERIPVSEKRDVGAIRACQQHIRFKLPPEPGLEIVSYAVQSSTDSPSMRSVFLAYRADRAQGPDGRPRQGMQQCAFETEDDGNFPPFKDLSRAVFRSEGETQVWKERFLRGEKVAELEPGRPECCLPIPQGGDDGSGNIISVR
ncbi:MAG TPA: hypothetical protein VF509_07545 [Sphingobium sp.]